MAQFHQAPLTLEEVQLDILLCEHGNLAAGSVVDIRTSCEGDHMFAVNAAANSAGSIYSASQASFLTCDLHSHADCCITHHPQTCRVQNFNLIDPA